MRDRRDMILANEANGRLGVFLDPPAVAVLVFDGLLNATAIFNHGSFGFNPPWWDRLPGTDRAPP